MEEQIKRRKMISSFLVENSGKVGAPGSVLLIAMLLFLYQSAESVLVETPTNATVIANQSTFFNCSKSGNKSEQLTWHHYAVNGQAEGVYESGSIRGTYKGRFDIDINITSGSFNLLVQRAETSDAGRYACVEDPLGKDPGASAELTVLDSDLVCQANMVLDDVIGSTHCYTTIPSDEPLLSCSVTFSGSIAPQMEWRNDEMASESLKTECNTADNRVMCNTSLNTNFIKDDAVFVCQLATAKKYNCSLKVNKTIYTFSDNSLRNISLMDEASCSANTSAGLNCSYKWYKGNQTEQLGQTLKANKSGIYRCEAECTIRNETCAFTAKQINVLESGSNTLHFMWVLLLIPIIGVILAIKYRQRLLSWLRRTCGDLDSQSSIGKTRRGPTEQELQELISKCSNKKDEIDAIEGSFNELCYMRKGLSGGEIRGPVHYKNIKCACMYEKIKCYSKKEEETLCVSGDNWMVLNHKNLIKVLDVVLRYPNVYVVMEHVTGESVKEALKNCAKDLPVDVLMDWITQIARGLTHLHENGNGIVHRNIKSAAIFIVESSDIGATLKIACFDFFDDNCVRDDTSITERTAYLPPEECKGGGYSEKYDVWSFGIVIWEMLSRAEPYKGMGSLEINDDICKGATKLKIPASCPNELREILNGCRQIKPSNRPSFNDILLRLEKRQSSSPFSSRSPCLGM